MTGRSLQQRSQSGAALLTAMIIVTLVATMASAMVWRQYRAVQIEAAERARAQASWILQGSLDWARLILREDARADRDAQRRGEQAVDHLGEVWAVPLAEARLSTFLAADKSNADDGPEAFLSGSLEDAQSRYNLRHLLSGKVVPPLEQRVLERLIVSAGAAPGTAALIINKLRSAYAVLDESSDSGSSGGNEKAERASVNSAFFIVNGRLRLEERVLEERSLVQRRDLEILVLDRQRVVPKIESKP
jgi:general secretion pathway protein K